MKGLFPGDGALSGDAGHDPDARRKTASAFDPEGARRHMGVDRERFRRIFDCIWNEVTERRSLLDEAFLAGDLTSVVLQAHTIKSSAAAIGALALSRAAAALEEAAAAGRLADVAAAMDAVHVARTTLGKIIGMV